jgi:peptidylprolyl isomerase
MARDNDNDSANSQFFLMRAPNSVLEKRYTAFGVVLSGLDVVRKIKIGEPPVNPDKMLTVRVLADIPPAERPQIEVMDTMSPQFRTIIDQTRKAKGADFSVCDVQVPVKVTKVTGAPVASAAK